MDWLTMLQKAARILLPRRSRETTTKHPDTVDEVIDRLEQIHAGLQPSDGVASFNRMYLDVTRLVRDKISAGYFGDPASMARLDVVFASLYLEAVDTPPGSTPKAWAPLFNHRDRPQIQSIQFALAGMNAHINHDLPLAVVKTCEELGIAPTSRPFADDYDKVTTLLCEVEEQVRQSYLSGIALRADHEVSEVVTLIGNWSIGAARKAAWANALALWAIRDVEPIRDEFLKALARSVGMAGAYLLTPVNSRGDHAVMGLDTPEKAPITA